MVETISGEQQPEDTWVFEAYARIQAGDLEELPIGERIGQILHDYPDLPQEGSGSKASSPLQLKFRHFSQTLLGTSSDIETFEERAGFLYSAEFQEYYANAIKQPKDNGVIQKPSDVARIGLNGLFVFSEQHPEHREAAVGCMAEHFLQTNKKMSRIGKTALANIVGTNSELFRDQIEGGYFHDVPPNAKQKLAIEWLQQLDFGKLGRAIGATAIHQAVYAPLKAETTYQLRIYNNWLTSAIEARSRGESRRTAGYEDTGTAKLYSDAYGMLRRAASYVAELGSTTATKLLEGLPEPRRGQPIGRDRMFALANVLTDQMNTVYFHGELRLQRLDKQSSSAQLQAFDRILYILHKELPSHQDPKVDAQQNESLSLVGQIASGLIELAATKMEERNPLTIGDIIAMYPDADPETIQTIITSAKSRFERFRGQGNIVYTRYRSEARRKNQLLFMRHTPGKGFIS